MMRPKIDTERLNDYLEARVSGFRQLRDIASLTGGNSNPTYRLTADTGTYVLRRKPAGSLLKSAHAVDREFRVLKALAGADLPVPKVLHLCEDESIIGSIFYVMEYLDGRVFWSPQLPELTSSERHTIYTEMNDLLIRLHNLDVVSAGLADYGNAANASDYFGRQIARWTKQYRASETRSIPAVEAVVAWLACQQPGEAYEPKLVHGDFRLDNLIFSRTRSAALGILDWELSTLGHPYADIAYQCMQWRLPVEREELRGLGGINRGGLGIPTEEEYVERYCRGIGVECLPNWNFYLGVSFFRLIAICQGIYRRGLESDSANQHTKRFESAVECIALTALEVLE